MHVLCTYHAYVVVVRACIVVYGCAPCIYSAYTVHIPCICTVVCACIVVYWCAPCIYYAYIVVVCACIVVYGCVLCMYYALYYASVVVVVVVVCMHRRVQVRACCAYYARTWACYAYAMYTPCTCHARATHMPRTCHVHAMHMLYVHMQVRALVGTAADESHILLRLHLHSLLHEGGGRADPRRRRRAIRRRAAWRPGWRRPAGLMRRCTKVQWHACK